MTTSAPSARQRFTGTGLTSAPSASQRPSRNTGVKMPYKWVFAWVDGKDTFELQEIQTNVRIDPARFERPSVAVVKK